MSNFANNYLELLFVSKISNCLWQTMIIMPSKVKSSLRDEVKTYTTEKKKLNKVFVN